MAFVSSFTGAKLGGSRPTMSARKPQQGVTMQAESDRPMVFDPSSMSMRPADTFVVIESMRGPTAKTYNATKAGQRVYPKIDLPKASEASNTPFVFDPFTMSIRKSSGLSTGGNLPYSYNEKGDKFLAESLTRKYKADSMDVGGTYSTACTEGTYKGAAYQTRARVLNAQYRMNQMSTFQKVYRKYRVARQHFINANNASHEDSKVFTFPERSNVQILKKAEAMKACDRYVSGSSVAEQYMANSVEKQMLAKTMPYGEYSLRCADGNTKDLAESARVAALATGFRRSQQTVQEKEKAKFAARKFAIQNYGKGCDHEEKQFWQYPAMAATMRGAAYY